jgi:outer membrane receptor protein involved in Fe transport
LVFGCVAISFLAIDIGIASAQLDEIMVRARKRDESARNIPVQVTLVSSEQLGRYNLKSLSAVAELTPSLTIFRSSAGNGASINIRGIGPMTTSIGVEQSVAVILDGVYYGQGRVINEGLFDASQIEILKGPQAVFFGKNATAGAINIRTNDPGDEYEFLGSVGYEVDNEEVYVEAIASGPINDKVGIRLAARWANQFGGYSKNEVQQAVYVVTDAEQLLADGTVYQENLDVPVPAKTAWPQGKDLTTRLTMMFTPSDELTMRLKATYNEYSSASTSGVNELVTCNGGGANNAAPGFSQFQPEVACTADWKVIENPFPTALAATSSLANKADGDLFDDYVSYGATADAEYASDEMVITSVVNFQHLRNAWGGDFDTSGVPGVYAAERNTYKAFSAEIRALSTFDSNLNFMIGAYHQSTTAIFDQDVIFAGAWNPAVADPKDEYTAYAKTSATDGSTYSIYAQLIWDIQDNLELTGGARYHHEQKTSFFAQTYVNPLFLGLFSEGRLDERQKWNDISPEVTLTWTVNENVTAYVAYKEAFKSGGFSISGILGVISGTSRDFLFDNETSEGFEGGIKASLFDNTFQIDLNVYNYKFNDMQIDFFNSAVFALITENAGGAKTTGAEAQFRWAPKAIDGLRINGSLAYNNARYTDFVAPCWAGQAPSEGCDIFNPGEVPKQQLAGFKRNLAPKFLMNLGFDYEKSVGNGQMIAFSLNTQYRGRYSASAWGHPDNFQSPSVIVNGAIRLIGNEDAWEFAVIGKNLTNKYLQLNTIDSPSSGSAPGFEGGVRGDQRTTPNRPRSIAVQLSVRY